MKTKKEGVKMTGIQWLAVTLALVIAVPILWNAVGYFLRRRDFKRQVEGKRPERKAGKHMRVSGSRADVNTAMDLDRIQWESKMKQNRHWSGW